MANLLAAAVLAGAVAAAIAAAPVAGADRGDTPGPSTGGSAKADNPGNKFTPTPRGSKGQLSSEFSANLPTGWTNEALWARPGAAGSPFGSGPKPPVIGLD